MKRIVAPSSHSSLPLGPEKAASTEAGSIGWLKKKVNEAFNGTRDPAGGSVSIKSGGNGMGVEVGAGVAMGEVTAVNA
jgi:hypothetical protein